jgi:hypothetical protein
VSRKKRKAGHREPNGRLSRRILHTKEREEMSMREAQSVAIAARMRHTGLPEAVVSLNVAGRPNAGSVHGVMCLRGEKNGGISREQWDAAEWWIGKRASWLRAIDAPNQETGASPAGEFDPDRHAQFCKHAIEQWAAITDCIQTASTEARAPLAAALDVFLVRGHHLNHMAGDLRLALNAIQRRFLAQQRRAA